MALIIWRCSRGGAALFGLLCLACLSGCVTRPKPLYHWGSFPDQQYAYFKGVTGPEGVILELEKIREEAASKGKPLPPGFRAHLGMLYGLTGRTDLFEQNLLAEQQQFPECTAYVDFLMKKKAQAGGANAKK